LLQWRCTVAVRWLLVFFGRLRRRDDLRKGRVAKVRCMRQLDDDAQLAAQLRDPVRLEESVLVVLFEEILKDFAQLKALGPCQLS
jgi:hypothetical protein